MAEQYEYEEEDEFQQTGGGWWIQKIGIIVYMLIIVAYAVQTLQLVNWLFPADNWFMMIVTVFVCDGCATGYAMAEMFYRFKLRRSKHLAFGMWIVTFVLSTAATVIQMYLSSTHNIPHKIDPSIITLAYGLVILAFVVNIIAITIIIRMEYGAGRHTRYLDDNKPRKVKRPQPTAQPAPAPIHTTVQQIDPAQLNAEFQQFLAERAESKKQASVSNVMSSEQPSTPVQPAAQNDTQSRYDWLARQQIRMEREAEEEKQRIAAARLRALAEEVRQQEQSPLQSAPMETGSQAGMNGNGSH